MRKADKSQLAHAILKYSSNCSSSDELGTTKPTDRYILDGGSLLHRISWNNSDTYEEIAQSYVDFVRKTYGEAIIVFDSYNESPTIKRCNS